jgi:hypothetical protein
MPDDHCTAMPQVTVVDDQFGTHSRTRTYPTYLDRSAADEGLPVPPGCPHVGREPDVAAEIVTRGFFTLWEPGVRFSGPPDHRAA